MRTVPGMLMLSLTTAAKRKHFLVLAATSIPLLLILFHEFLLTRRGVHSQEVQFQVTFWTIRLLLAPILVVYTLRFWKELNDWRLLLIQILGFLAFSAIVVGISFMVVRYYLVDFDNRNWNLFQTIRKISYPWNLVTYLATVAAVYTWTYFERLVEARRKIIVLESSQGAESGKKSGVDQFVLKIGSTKIAVPISQIVCFKAYGPYVKVVTDQRSHILSRSLKSVAAEVPDSFIKIHRSTIIRADLVSGIRPLTGGDAMLSLRNGMEIRASRTYKKTWAGILKRGNVS